jgi:hypothetical protein
VAILEFPGARFHRLSRCARAGNFAQVNMSQSNLRYPIGSDALAHAVVASRRQ